MFADDWEVGRIEERNVTEPSTDEEAAIEGGVAYLLVTMESKPIKYFEVQKIVAYGTGVPRYIP